jgi:hypothetical protein
MTVYILQQIFQVMFDPEYTTASLYDSPRLGDTFIIVSLYAFFTSLDSFLQGYLRTSTVSVGVLSFFISTLSTFLLWVVLAMVFHIGAELLGGLGELPNALGFVGLGMAPLIFTSILRCVLTVLSIEVYFNDPDKLLAKAGFGLNLIGMAWGTPGIICYFGMKNAEKVHMLKALLVTLILFLALAALLVFTSDLF